MNGWCVSGRRTRSLRPVVRAAEGFRHRIGVAWPGSGRNMDRRAAAATAAAAFLLSAIPAVNRADSRPAHAAVTDAAVRVVRFTAEGPAVTAQVAGYAGGGLTMSVPPGSAPTAGGYAPLAPG